MDIKKFLELSLEAELMEAKKNKESTAEKDDKAEKAAKKVAKDIEYDEGHKGKDDDKAEKAGEKVKKDIEYDDKKDKKKKSLKDWFEQVDKQIIAEQQNLQIKTMPASPSTSITDPETGTTLVTTEPSVVSAAKSGKVKFNQLKEKEKEDKPNLKHLKRQYKDNESNNAHTENAVLLATHFGSDEEVAHARAALRHRDKQGGYNSGDKEANNHLKKLHKIHTKYGFKLSEEVIEEAEKWIQKAIKKPGALKKQLGVPADEKIPAAKLNAAAKKGGKLGQRARLAQTLKSLNKEDVSEQEMDESGLQAYLGKKKYGEKGMKELQQAGREGASEEEKGKIKDRLLGKKKTNEDEVDEGDSQIAFKGAMQNLKNFFDLESPGSNRISKMLDSVEFKQVLLNILTNTNLRKEFKEIFIKGMEMPISSFYISALSSTDSKKDTSKKSEIDEADRPLDGDQLGPGSHSARNKYVLEKTQVTEAMDTRKIAYHEGKAMGLQHKHACKYNEGSEEHKSFHEGFMKGIDECYNSGVKNMPIVGMEEDSMPPATVPGMASAAMPSIPTMEADMDEGNAFTAALKATPKGEKFKLGGKTFTDNSSLEEEGAFAFEDLDKQLNSLLNESSEPVVEGLSVSMSTGQQGAPDSVSVTGTDDEAGKLLTFIKQVGLGGMGADTTANEPAAVVTTVSDYGGPKFAGHDNYDMKAYLQKVDSEDYKDEEGHEADHGEPCNECGMYEDKCECDEGMTETQTPDQLEADSISEDDGEGYTASQKDDGKIDSALALSGASKGGAMNEGGDGMEDDENVTEAKKHKKKESTAEKDDKAEKAAKKVAKDIEYDEGHKGKDDDKAEKAGEKVKKDIEYDDKKDKKKKVDEWANDAGKDSLDAAFEQDIEFMMNIISGGLNKRKSTGQQTIPVLAGDEARTNINEDIHSVKKLAGLI